MYTCNLEVWKIKLKRFQNLEMPGMVVLQDILFLRKLLWQEKSFRNAWRISVQ